MSRELTPAELALAREFVEASDNAKHWAEVRQKLRDQLAASVDEDEGTVNGDTAVTVSRVHPRLFNSARFRTDHPALYASYVEPTEDARVTVHVRDTVFPGGRP